MHNSLYILLFIDASATRKKPVIILENLTQGASFKTKNVSHDLKNISGICFVQVMIKKKIHGII